jgi:hypothetical protein
VQASARGGERGPWLVLAAAIIGIAVLAASVNVRVNTFVLDETLLKASAVHYTSGLPDSLFHDLAARGTARLYSLLLVPLFAVFDGDVAVRAARAFNAFLFASAAVPLFLLARRIVVSRWAGVAAAVLGGAAVPWLILSSVIYTENLAWPLYFWTAWAIVRVLERPGPGRDLATMALLAAGICTRVQFAALLPAYLFLVVCREWPRPRPPARKAGDHVIAVAHRYPALATATAIGVVMFAVLLVTGQLHARIASTLGAYSEFQDRQQLPSDTLQATLVEVVSLSLGIGLLPAIVGASWYASALRRDGAPAQRLVASVTLVMGAALVALVVYAQGGYLAELTEERYFIYLAPMLWLGTFAALEQRDRVSTGALAGFAVGLAMLMGSIPLIRGLDIETVFLAPVQEAAARVLKEREALGVAGLSRRDVLGYGTLLLGLGAAFSWRRHPAVAVSLTLGVGVGLQLAFGLYAWSVTDGKVAGVGSRTATPPTMAQLGWIDRRKAPGEPVYVGNLLGTPVPQALAAERRTIFYNDDLAAFATVPQLGLPDPSEPITALPHRAFAIDVETGRLSGPPPLGLVIEHPNSPAWQIAAGAPLAEGPDQGFLVMRRAATPNRVIWTAAGLDREGIVHEGTTVPLRLYPGAVPGRAAHVKMVVAPPPARGATSIAVRMGRQEVTLDLPLGSVPRELNFDVCLGSRPVSGELRPLSSAPALNAGMAPITAVLTFVQITPAEKC